MSQEALLSSLVRSQLPEFIRADYETFVAFIEAYYEYLEQTKKATDFGKHLLQYADVDRTLSDFEEYFVKTFLPLIPADLINNKPALIKSVKQFYAAKGTEKSFKFFFRALYKEDVDLFYPKDFVLRTSDGKYVQRNSLRCANEYFTTATGNGTTKTFRLVEVIAAASDLAVYVNGVLQTSGYTISLNEPFLTFATAPTAGHAIKFVFFSDQLLNAINAGGVLLDVTGVTSGAKASVERANKTILGNTRSTELFITPISSKTFSQGELVTAQYYYTNNDYFTLTFTLLSLLESITIVNGGASYNVGDSVLVTGGNPTTAATAIVEKVYLAVITKIFVLSGGAGFRVGDLIHVISTPNTGLSMAILSNNDNEYYHANTLSINNDVISLYANVAINAANYGFPVSGNENQNTRVIDALSSQSISGLGPITNVQILSSTTQFASLPVLDADSSVFSFTSTNASSNTANGVLRLVDLGILGRMNVVNGGNGYVPGDEVVFTNLPMSNVQGWGAAAEVITVHPANNGISTVKFQPPRINGTVNANSSGVIVTGTGTNFLGELVVGDRIELNNESRYINTITSNTSLTVNVAWTKTSTNRKLGVHDLSFIGGERYCQDYLPTVTISSANGIANGANIIVEAIYSDGEQLLANSSLNPGAIQSILITNSGAGYTSVPLINLTGKGNGLATAIANLFVSRFVYSGKFITTDSLLSSDRRLQNRDYYQNFSYVIQSQIDFPRYKQILLDLLHPAGMRVFGEYMLDEQVIAVASTTELDQLVLETTLGGTVNVGAASLAVTGTGTTFNVAQSQNVLTAGTTIQVNNQLRVVNTIINNTSLTVTNSFTYTSNAQTMVALKTI